MSLKGSRRLGFPMVRCGDGLAPPRDVRSSHSRRFSCPCKGRRGILFRWGLFATPLVVLSFIIGLQWGIVGVAASYAVVALGLRYAALSIRLVGLKMSEFIKALLPTLAVQHRDGALHAVGTSGASGHTSTAGEVYLISRRPSAWRVLLIARQPFQVHKQLQRV